MAPYPPRFPMAASSGDETFDYMLCSRRGPSTPSITEQILPLHSSERDPTHHFCLDAPLSEDHPWSFLNQCSWHGGVTNRLFASTTQENQQTQHSIPLWGPMNMQTTPEWFPAFPSPITVNEARSDNVTSVSHLAYHPNLNDTFCHNDTTSAFLRTLRPNSSNKPLTSFAKPGMGRIGCHLDELNANRIPSHAVTSHHQNAPDRPDGQNMPFSLPPFHLRSHCLFESSSPYFPPLPRATETLGSAHRIHSSLAQDSVTSSCRKRDARAIQFGGLWVDEDELVKGLSASNGKLNVLQCRWDENRSPCDLWIKGDKSSINMHIQRWHGGKPGGDKLEVECFWSGCKTKMLKESIPRHIVSIHLKEMWECRGCGKGTARYDVHRRHIALSNLEACRTSGALITYSADVRVIDVRAALSSGGKVKRPVV